MREINFYSRTPEWSWLSNFHMSPQTVTTGWGTHTYASNEHFYQSMKARTKADHDKVRRQTTPFKSMKMGRSIPVRADWDQTKIMFMRMGLVAKFENEVLRKKLLNTGDAILHEDSPRDMFWGKKGLDHLGKLLMDVREELRT